MLRDQLKTLVVEALARLVASGHLPEAALAVPVEIGDPKNPEHGDFALNYALVAAKPLGLAPRVVAEALRDELAPVAAFQAVEVAGPGFVNLRLDPAFVASFLGEVLAQGEAFVRSEPERPMRINVEFVSVNPNGPITVGSGRGAAFGSTLCNVLQAAGHTVHREYYINDGVNSEQMRLFAESVRAHVLGTEFPEKGYKGEYVKDVAAEITDGSPESSVGWWQGRSQALMLERQRQDLLHFGVSFDRWFSEQSLHDRGEVDARIVELLAKGVADEEPFRTVLKMGKRGEVESASREEQPADDEDAAAQGEGRTLWLRSTKFGDDMDRVLRRKDGRLTYISSDVAYHADKFHRPENADKLITILGPDHHGYIGRLQAVVAALLGAPERPADRPLEGWEEVVYRSAEERAAAAAALDEAKRRLEVVIFQIVRFVKDGKPAPMRKRDGNIYELRDLIDELGKNIAPSAEGEEQRRIGADVARFFYLMRSHDTHMDFDIDLATKQSDENPVFYAQYAHARICSVLRRAAEDYAGEADLSLLVDPRETALIKKILELPVEVRRCAEDYGVNRLTNYAVELGRTYHHFYDACRVIQADQPELTRARLALCRGAQTALRATFSLLGVSAPERMERESV